MYFDARSILSDVVMDRLTDVFQRLFDPIINE
jgi:hypothetical protein